MEANTLLRKVHMNCPLCDKTHEVEERKRVTSIVLKGEEVTYEERFYFCANADEDENEFEVGAMTNENLLNARNQMNSNTAKLFELIELLIKHTSLNISKIRDFEPDYNEFDFEVIRLSNLLNFPTTREDKLERRINEFLDIYLKIKKKLYNTYEKNYGKCEDTKVNLSCIKGKSILVSGGNLKELELLLETTKNANINIYTHDILFVAHSYPKFKKYNHLIGHFGTNDPCNDFLEFNGPIYVTKNYEQKIDSIIKASIFSSGKLLPRGIAKITNDNFKPLIENAMLHDGFQDKLKQETTEISYKKTKTDEIFADTKDIIIYIGKKSENIVDETGKNILFFNYFFEIENLLYELKERKQKTTVIFSKCYMQTIFMALVLKTKFNMDVYFSKCPEYYISPNLVKCLEDKYKIVFYK